MAKDKKGFVLYADLIHTVKKMPIEKRGLLFTTILEYVNDENPIIDDILIDLVFEPIKRQLKRDLKKYESRANRSRENGKKGGRPITQKNPLGYLETQNNLTEPKKPDTVTVIDTVTDNVKVRDKVLNSHSWIDTIGMKKNLRKDDVVKKLNVFLDELEVRDDLGKGVSEIKKHFANWLNKKDEQPKRLKTPEELTDWNWD